MRCHGRPIVISSTPKNLIEVNALRPRDSIGRPVIFARKSSSEIYGLIRAVRHNRGASPSEVPAEATVGEHCLWTTAFSLEPLRPVSIAVLIHVLGSEEHTSELQSH